MPITVIVPDGSGFRASSTTYGDFVNDPAAAAAWRGEEGQRLRQSMPPPTPGADISRGTPDASPSDSGITAPAAQGIAACDDDTFTVWGAAWPNGYYTYYTRNSSFPAGTTTRVEITRGHHAWDHTDNNCGFSDITDLTSDWIGTTSTTFHTTPDTINVVDFGDMANIGKSNSMTIGYARVWWNGSSMVESDQRYNQYKTWVHSGQSYGYDVWDVATHETGHTIGIDGDYYKSGSHTELTMYCCVSYGMTKQRTLGRGDILGMRNLYP